jgi:hypothetical protein
MSLINLDGTIDLADELEGGKEADEARQYPHRIAEDSQISVKKERKKAKREAREGEERGEWRRERGRRGRGGEGGGVVPRISFAQISFHSQSRHRHTAQTQTHK